MSEGVVHQLHQKNGQARVLIVRHAQILHDVGVAGLTEEAALLLEQGAVLGPAGVLLTTNYTVPLLISPPITPLIIIHFFLTLSHVYASVIIMLYCLQGIAQEDVATPHALLTPSSRERTQSTSAASLA